MVLKHRAYFIAVTVFVVSFAAVVMIEAIRYPLNGSLFQITGVSKSDVIAVEIIYHGDIVRITDMNSVDSLLLALDSSMTRELFYENFTGGDWTLRLITKDGYLQFLLLPYSIGKIDTRVLLNDRMHILDTQIELNDLEKYLVN